jgi:hypothetical protein
MQWEMIPDQWIWLSAAAVFVVFVAALAARSLSKPKPHDKTKSHAVAQNGWTATGRIDFVDPQSKGDFILQVEETRIVDTMGGVEHREIRWQKGTLDEAKTVLLVSYHAQRNLTMTANFIVSSPTVMRRSSDGRSEQQEIQVKQNGASAPHSESDAKIAKTATELTPTASD